MRIGIKIAKSQPKYTASILKTAQHCNVDVYLFHDGRIWTWKIIFYISLGIPNFLIF